jgi:cell division protein ZapE
MNILDTYLSIDGLRKDSSQLEIVRELSFFQHQLDSKINNPNFFNFLTKIKNNYSSIKGVYLWGDVGRGKTFLMDLFFRTLLTKKKKREHFHRMMDEINNKLRDIESTKNPIDQIIKSIAKKTKVICFDEFFVEDIGDAMILNKFLESLFKNNITLFITSNSKPDELYKNGLQRELFIPAIELIKNNMEVIEIKKGIDHRQTSIENKLQNLSINNNSTNKLLKDYVQQVSCNSFKENLPIIIRQREIPTLYLAEKIVWFTFNVICGENRSTKDYIDIANKYETVIISDVPALNESMENEARRFIALVDEFYDHGTNLFLTTNKDFRDLYQGNKLNAEYERTKSRLIEMMSKNLNNLYTTHIRS